MTHLMLEAAAAEEVEEVEEEAAEERKKETRMESCLARKGKIGENEKRE